MKGENIFKLCLLFLIIGFQVVGFSASSGKIGVIIGGGSTTQVELQGLDTFLGQTYELGGGYSALISKFENVNSDNNFIKRIWVEVMPPEGDNVYLYTYAVPYPRSFTRQTVDPPGDDDVDPVDGGGMGGPDWQVPIQTTPTYEDEDTSARATDYVGWDDFY
jgi:hypothetical protein